MAKQSDLSPGDEVAGYLILSEIETSPIGPLYMAEGPDGARVRLRALSETLLGDKPTRNRILRDLAALQGVEHPRVARMIAWVEEPPPVCYALEHGGSVTLAEAVLRCRPLNQPELVWVGLGLCEGLAQLHDAGLPHGELSTNTVILTRGGPLINDLGWSTRVAGQDPTLTDDMRALASLLELCAGGDLSAVSEDVASLVRVLDMGSAKEAAQAFSATARRLELGEPDLSDFLTLLEASQADGEPLPTTKPEPPRSLLDAKPDPRVETRQEIASRLVAAGSTNPAEAIEGAAGLTSDQGDLAAGTSESALASISDEELAELERDISDDEDEDDELSPYAGGEDGAPAEDAGEDPDADDAFDTAGHFRPHTDDVSASSDSEDEDDDEGPAASDDSSDEYEGPRARKAAEPEPEPEPEPTRDELTRSEIATLAQSTSLDDEHQLPPLRESTAGPVETSGDELEDVSSGDHTPLPAADAAADGSEADRSEADRSEEGPAFASADELPPVVAPDLAESRDDPLADSGVTPIVDATPLHDPIGRFQPLEELARTAVHTTFLALDTEADQRVALRVYRSGTPKRDADRKRLLREAETAEGLEHPAFVRIQDSGVDGERLWIAMDVPPGRPLPRVWADAKVRDEDLLRPLLEVCRAVEHANGVGILAGILPPADIRVGKDGSAHLVAFGVGAWVGTGKGRGQVSPTSEAQVLGRLLYEALTRGVDPLSVGGLPPKLLGSPPAPSCYAPVSAAVDAVLLEALQPERGYASPGELAQDLERVVAGTPPLAHAPGAGYRLKQLLALHPIAPALVLVLLIGLGVGYLERDALRQLAGLPAPAGASPAPAPSASPTPPPPSSPPVRPAPGVPGDDAAVTQRLIALGHEAEAAGELGAARQLYAAALDETLNAERQPAPELEDSLDRVLDQLREADRLRAASDEASEERAARGRAELARGRAALDAGQPAEARRALVAALLAGEAAAEPLLAQAEDALAAERVRDALTQRGDGPPSAADPVDVERLVRERLAADREQRAAEAVALVAEGREALEREAAAPARDAFLRALALNPSDAEAQAGLRAADQLLQRAASGQQGADERRAEASRLVREGAQALKQRDFHAARRAFHGALILDPQNAHAQEGLARLTRAEAQATQTETAREVAQLLGSAREANHEAEAAEGRRRIASYASALGLLESALRLDPENKTLASERDDVIDALADLLGGGGAAAFTPQANREDPDDPFLQIVEADRVTVDRTLGGNVRFEPTRILDPLRDWVKNFEDGRFQLVIQVRSRAETLRGRPPRVIVTGLQMRVLDKQAKTLYPWQSYDFTDGPHYRNVIVDAAGRIVRPFNTAHSLNVPVQLERINERAKQLLLDARARNRPAAEADD